MKLKEIFTFKKLEKKFEEKNTRMVDWSNFFEDRLQNRFTGVFISKIKFRNERIILPEALRRDFQHRHRVVHMQKQLDEASKESHEEIVSGETVMLRREDDESSKFQMPMADWKTSNQYKEIHELEANNIALKGSLNDTKSLVCHTDLRSC